MAIPESIEFEDTQPIAVKPPRQPAQTRPIPYQSMRELVDEGFDSAEEDARDIADVVKWDRMGGGDR